MFSHKWGMGADGKPKPFDQVIDEYPITTGPYTIASADSGRRIDFALDPNYWARDLNVRRGQFNFERIVYRLFRDRSISMEAFKAGEFEIIQEFTPQQYVRLHDGAKWRDGRIVKKNFEYGMGKGMQAYLLNLRRPIFQDARVREALDYSYDFEKINLYNQRRRNYSLFSNSDFAADGHARAGRAHAAGAVSRARLPPEVFGDVVPAAAHRHRSERAAREPEEGARTARGSRMEGRADGVLRNAKGEPFEFEYLEPESTNQFRTVTGSAISPSSASTSSRASSTSRCTGSGSRPSTSTPSRSARRDFALPSALDYQETLGSKSADVTGSGNFRGLKDPAVDAMIAAMSAAKTYDELRDACARTRPAHHVRPLPGAAALRAGVFDFLLEQVRHPEDRAQVLHDRRVGRLARVGRDRVVEQGRGGPPARLAVADALESLKPCWPTSSSGSC